MSATARATFCTQCGHELTAKALFCPACGTPKSQGTDTDPLIGQVIGQRFLVVGRLGEGSSGTIYRGEHTTLRRKVAIKILHQDLCRDDLAVERFRREAITVSDIDNDHIVEIYDFGRTPDERLYLVMELLDGETLRNAIEREKRLPIDLVIDILIQLGEALTEAHAMGYVHRDLRPRNIYLAVRRGRKNYVKLLDFGLAKLVENEGNAATTSLGMNFGDPKYMSPEQARGETIDRRADIYSLGCIAYEMLVGQPPFATGRSMEILSRHVDTTPESPRALRPDVPDWLDATVMRMLAKQPGERFVTVFRLVGALRQGEQTGEVMSDEMARRRETIQPPVGSRSGAAIPVAPLDPQVGTKTVAKESAEPQANTGATPGETDIVADQAEVKDTSTEPPAQPEARDGASEQPPAAADDPDQAASAPDGSADTATESECTDRAEPAAGTDTGSEDKNKNKNRGKAIGGATILGVAVASEASTASATTADNTDSEDPVDDEPSALASDPHGDSDDDPDRQKDSDENAETVTEAVDQSAAVQPHPDVDPGDSDMGLSGAWFADGDRKQDAELDDRLERQLAAARENVARDATDTYDDLYIDDGKRRLMIIGGVIGGLVLILIVLALAWPSDKGKSKVEKPADSESPDDILAKLDSPDAGTDIAVAALPDAAPSVPDAAAAPPDPPGSKTNRPGGKTNRPGGNKPGGNKPGGKPDKPSGPSVSPAQAQQAKFFAKIGNTHLRNGDLTQASTNFDKALGLNPRDLDATIGKGEVALKRGKTGIAIKTLSKAASRSRSTRVYNLLGDAFMRTGNHQKAADNYKKALRINPDDKKAREGYTAAAKLIPPPPDDEDGP